MTIQLTNEPQIGLLKMITSEPAEIMSDTPASGHGVSYAVWHTPPTEDEDEAIFISLISYPESGARKIFVGADPDCLPTEAGGYLSWLRVDPERAVLFINLSTFTNDLRITSTKPVATLVPGSLITRPYLAEYDGEPCLVYSYHDDEKRLRIRTYFINSGVTTEDVLPVHSPQDMVVKWSSHHLAAVIETDDGMELLTFDGSRWRITAKLKKKGIPPNRFDFAVGDATAMFVVEVASPLDGLAALAVDLSTGVEGDMWPISKYGKFPGIALADGYWVISWVGSPAVPVDIQSVKEGEVVIDPHIQVLRRIADEVEAQERETGVRRDRSEIETLFGSTFVSPWVPLWLGVLSEEGEFLKSYGPLGGGADENWSTQLSARGGRGLLLWRSSTRGADQKECLLKAREVALPVNLEQ